MDKSLPIYTEKTECQDCYKCLRACPFKAIRIFNGSASVIKDMCVLCGRCTEICPAGAKKIRDDLPLAEELVRNGFKVYASLAPSFKTEFKGLSEAKLISAIKALGFAGVSETALGAQEISSACASLIDKAANKMLISSACPTVVHLIEQYYPNLTDNITPLLSPLQAHSRLLRTAYGEDVKIVFFGPCISKKTETDGNFDYALTFNDLRRWFTRKEIDWIKLKADGEFIPHSSSKGSLYPIDGGMIDGVRNLVRREDVTYMSFSGMKEVISAFDELGKDISSQPIFIEALACTGGCINGPVVSEKTSMVSKRFHIIKGSSTDVQNINLSEHEVKKMYSAKHVEVEKHQPAEIRESLMRISKKRSEDELNCGGCGYETCREFAAALIEEKAETSMCVSYLRKLAHNKAAALLKSMPSGVVIVDDNLKIIESNRKFIELIGGHADIVSLVDPDLEGVYLDKLVPFHKYFTEALSTDDQAKTYDIRYENKIVRLTVFTIQAGQIVGGILHDVTKPLIQREQIIDKAGEVMKKNLNTVQKIAFLLGENAAESEVLLNSIIESFSNKDG